MGAAAVDMAYDMAERLQDAYDGIMANAVTLGEDVDEQIEMYFDDCPEDMELYEYILQGDMPDAVSTALEEMMLSEKAVKNGMPVEGYREQLLSDGNVNPAREVPDFGIDYGSNSSDEMSL